MHHYFEAITNTSGDSLVGYFGRVINRTNNNTVTLASDDNGTPIVVVSGIENMAKTDNFGNLDFYVEPGTYDLEIYAPNATSLIMRVPNVAMDSGKGDRGDPGPPGEPGPQGAGLEDVMGPDGASLVGFTQNAPQSSKRSAMDKLREAAITPDDFPLLANDTLKVQAALDARGSILLTRTYSITSTLTMRGNTQLRGNPSAKLVWNGPSSGSILQDSSVVTTSDVNLNILLENFEIDGSSLVSGDASQRAINFYRVGGLTVRGMKIHGVGGSGIHWGGSMADTVGVLIENCQVWDCRQGDAIQGVGRSITIRNNQIGRLGSTTSNFGDTGVALLHDFSAVTNPNVSYSSDVEIANNTIIGNYNLAGSYVGNGQQIQTAIAFGPFKIGHAANIRVLRNTVYGCYLNLWGIVMDDVLVAQNNFGSHAATATGNIRFDGVTNLRVQANKITLRLAGTGPDYCAILLVSQRNTYGASVYDADISKYEVTGNTIASINVAQGIRATFEQVNSSPSYISRLIDGKIEDNTFTGVTTPLALAPQTGATANTCSNLVMRGNRPDSAATSLVMAGGTGAQYNATRLLDNPAPANVPPWSGTGANRLIVQHKAFSSVSAASGTATPILVLPSRSVRVDVHAYVDTGNADFSATATIAVNAGVASFKQQSDGAKLMLTLDGLTVRATQTAGATAPIDITATYS